MYAPTTTGRRTARTLVAVAAILATTLTTLVATGSPAHAAVGRPSSGTSPVTVEDRSDLELAAEGYALKAHNDQRAAGNARKGVSYGDVSSVGRIGGYSDIMTVSRKWADHIDLETFFHNPDYSKQYGHWSGAGENIAVTTIQSASRGTPTEQQVLDATEQLMQAWWNSEGHRVNWMSASWDHFAVGASVRVSTWESSSGPRDFWTLSLVANFRRHDGSHIDHVAFDADGSNPPNETDAAAGRTGPPGPFDDVPHDHLFVAPITRLAETGVTRGCNPGAGNTRFCPDSYVTRGQMAAFLTRALDLPAGDKVFDDTRGHLFEQPISALERAGITMGCNPGGGNTRFCPDAHVTRGQMAAFLTRALDLPAGQDSFTDARGHLFEQPISALARAGITKGCNPGSGNTRFCPDDRVTRGQMAAFLARAGVLD